MSEPASKKWHFQLPTQSGDDAELPDTRFTRQKPQHGIRKQSAAGTQPMQHGTPMLSRGRQAGGNAFTNGLASIIGEAAALAKLSRPDTGAPFAHMGQHLMSMGWPQKSHKPSRNGNSAAPTTDAHLQSSTISQPQVTHVADQASSTSRCEQDRMREDIQEQREASACSAAQPEAACRQGRKKHRGAAAPFACASAGAEGGSPPGEWKWPELPKWKPPRCSPGMLMGL